MCGGKINHKFTIDPDLWKMMTDLTKSCREATRPGKHIHTQSRKLRCFYCLCVLLFITNNQCNTPLHVLLTDVLQPLGQRSNCCRSRKSIREHVSMFNLFPVYNQFLLQVLSQLYFTSTTQNKDLQKEQPFLSPVVLVL